MEVAFTKRASFVASQDGIAFHDEFKLRLPIIVDGSYSLEFSIVTDHLDQDDERFCSLSLAPSRSIVGDSHGLDPVVDLKVLC